MSQHKHHHHHNHELPVSGRSLNTTFTVAITLNLLYLAVETVFGLVNNSMGLLSDAGHNLSDVATLAIAMIAFRMSRRKATEHYTYGFRKMTVIASLVNAVLLTAAVVAILAESIPKLVHPEAVDGETIAWVAGAGILVKGVTAWLLVRDKDRDINVKGAFLHMAADALVSVGVVVSGIVIHFTGAYVIDPIIGIIIAVVIGWSTFDLLRKSVRMSLDGVPYGINTGEVRATISGVEGVRSYDRLHIWPVSTTGTALTVHVDVASPADVNRVVAQLHERLSALGIEEATIEAVSGE